MSGISGDTLRLFRKANSLTQEKLGEYLGIKKSYVSSIEHGRDKLPYQKYLSILENPYKWDTSMLTKLSTKDRTLEFVQCMGITVREFERACGLPNGYVNSMRSGYGESKLSQVLLAYPELNRDWIVYGEGNMFRSSNSLVISENNQDAKIQELERRIIELQEDKRHLQMVISTLQSQMSVLLDKI